MELRQVKYLLRNYKRFQQSIKNLEDKREVLKTQATKITASYSSSGGSGGKNSNSKVESYSEKLEEIEENIKGYQQMIDTCDKMLKTVKTYQRELLIQIYIEGRTFESVAYQEDISLSNLHQVVSKTLNQLKDW